ncbi:MAG: hypothetical protein M1153_02780 [Patescibacteria group bacterium]|nr:hypothetical protein [Patescibacteria group bacterium]
MFLTPFGWKELRELNAGDQIYIQSGEGGWNKDDKLPVEPQNMTYGRNGRIYKKNLPASWSRELGQVLGWLTGDGWLSTKHHSLGWVFSEADLEVKDILQPTIEKWLNRPLSELETSSGVFQLRSASGPVADFFRQLGISEAGEDRVVPRAVFTATEDGVKGFIEGLFSSDGTIGIANESRRYVRLNSSSVKLLKDVQLLLLNFGIRSAIFDRSAKPKFFSYTKANGRKVRYSTSGRNYELNIRPYSLRKFAGSFDFLQKEKNKKLKNLADGQEFYRDYFIEEVRSITPAGKELVWDLTENSTHSFIANGMVIKNCGEVLLYPFESCNLGSVNVWAFVKEDGERKKYYDWERLGKVVRQATRFLDNVIDINNYPMAEIENFTLSTRKVGLGVMGVGDLLYEMELPYNSERGLEFMEELMEFVNYNSKLESIELAKERGSFPLFKQSFFAEGKLPFSGYKDKSKAKRNWKEIIDAVKKHGLRNSYTTVIAPTGSISMIAGTSSGMEPVFSLVFEKNVSVGSFYYVDPVFEEQMSEMGLLDDALIKEVAAGSGSVQEVEYIPEKQKKVFVTAMNIGPRDHIKALAAFQKWVDSSISKTINFPADATVDQMKEGYLLAYKLGCKGSTVYRDSSIQNQVLVAGAKEKKKAASAKAAVETGKELRQVEDVKAEGPVIYETPGAELETEVANGIPESEITHEIKFCPKCNTELVNKEGCKTCPACGWGLCL